MLPRSEYRRVYLRRLIRDVETTLRVTPKQAREIATGLVVFLKAKVHKGEEVDLGFLLLKLKTTKPREFKFNLNGTNNGRYFKGESAKWAVSVRGGWVRKAKPAWAH